MTPRALIPALLALLVAVPAASGGGPAPLQPEANATAAGDIPDNQVFLVSRSPAGYSMKYPEGWAQRGSGDAVVFRDKNNIVRIVVAAAPAPTKALVGRELGRDRVRIEGGRRKFVFPLGVG